MVSASFSKAERKQEDGTSQSPSLEGYYSSYQCSKINKLVSLTQTMGAFHRDASILGPKAGEVR